jgi:hypothetical protein
MDQILTISKNYVLIKLDRVDYNFYTITKELVVVLLMGKKLTFRFYRNINNGVSWLIKQQKSFLRKIFASQIMKFFTINEG